MRRLFGACAIAVCLAACGGGSEPITEVDGPFGGVYSLRQVNDAPLPLYFSPTWYPGRGSSMPNVLSTTLLSADLRIRPDGTFIWATNLEEVAARPNAAFLEHVVWTVRRETEGRWSYTESTGAVSLEGIDASGHYVLAGSMTNSVLTLSTTSPGTSNSRFVLER